MNPFVSSMRTVTKVVGFDSSWVKENSNNDKIKDNMQSFPGIPLYVSKRISSLHYFSMMLRPFTGRRSITFAISLNSHGRDF